MLLNHGIETHQGCERTMATLKSLQGTQTDAPFQEQIDAYNNKTKKCSHCGNDNSKTYKYNSPQRF